MLTRKPHRGDRLEYVENWDDVANGKATPHVVPCGTVDHIDGNLCHYNRPDGTADLFIWQHPDTLNRCFGIIEEKNAKIS